MVTIPPGTQQVFVSFSAEVNPNTTERLIAVMASCTNNGVKEVYLMISTPGGSVMNDFYPRWLSYEWSESL